MDLFDEAAKRQQEELARSRPAGRVILRDMPVDQLLAAREFKQPEPKPEKQPPAIVATELEYKPAGNQPAPVIGGLGTNVISRTQQRQQQRENLYDRALQKSLEDAAKTRSPEERKRAQAERELNQMLQPSRTL